MAVRGLRVDSAHVRGARTDVRRALTNDAERRLITSKSVAWPEAKKVTLTVPHTRRPPTAC
ncbi:hypothetical protein GCM10022224_027570 [Nonomuraea antimicrobica]|uniref:Transposase n=1 Tax=Nonomuraea antimicrobica TaxID=561173 RepID=A0ABP7BKW6_9ACTN